MESFVAIIILGILGLLMGLFLAYAAKKFEVKKEEIVEKIIEILPGVNCGACGYPGCNGYAEAIAKGADIGLCSPGGNEVRSKLEILTGKKTLDVEKKVARVYCQGDNTKVKKLYEFDADIKTCSNANLYFGGDKACMYSCLGYGDCKKVCPVDAIIVTDKGIVYVNEEKCISCEKCVKECPKKVIKMVPEKSKISVLCNNKEKAQVAKANCSVACITCGLCMRACPVNAIEINGNLAKIDYDKCINCGICALKCPTNAIKSELKEYRYAEIIEKNCIGCTACKRVCPVNAIEGEVKLKHKILEHKCIGCGLCLEKCKFDAISMRNRFIKE